MWSYPTLVSMENSKVKGRNLKYCYRLPSFKACQKKIELVLVWCHQFSYHIDIYNEDFFFFQNYQ